MRILQLTTGFIPRRGGIETVSSLLAREFARLGHESAVLTRESDAIPPCAGVEVVRAPRPFATLREIARADAVILHGVPLRLAWPLLALRKPRLLVRHMWDPPGSGRLRRAIVRGAPIFSVSRYLAALAGKPSGIMPNPYDADLFFNDADAPRERDLVFVGRATRDKGLLEFTRLAIQLAGERPGLAVTIVGDGPDLAEARRSFSEAGLGGDHVVFTGSLPPEAIARELRRHRLFVFPALWDEPFGIVVLEAIACGAPVVAYASGGIPEAIGPCGVVAPRDDFNRLRAEVARLLDDSTARAALLAGAPAHLHPHRPDQVARRYIAALAR